MNYLITVISRQLYAGWKWNKSNSRTQPDQPLWPILPPIWTVDAMCCCGTLCSPGRPQLGPRVLLYFSTAAVGGNETELDPPAIPAASPTWAFAGTCLLLLLEATPPQW